MRATYSKLIAAGIFATFCTGLIIAQEPWASTKEVMNSLTIPSSNALFNAGLEDENLTDEQWLELKNQAFVLGESANLLMMPGREPVDDSGNADWKAAAVQMLDAAKFAQEKIEARDLDGLTLEGSDKILQSCTACHMKYFQ